ncbi:MAG: ribosome assembly cofactor RimP [Bacteroidaceae bacterium]|nr:ribosome assembly cofactor RimP [Bacteroidaceae bacterium]
MIEKEKVQSIVTLWLDNTEYFLVDIQISADDRIVVEIDHKDGVWIDDCVELSRFIEQHLNRDEEDYELEVGSAGVGQPFKVRQQWLNHIGKSVEILTADGRKLRGTLKEVSDNDFTITSQVKRKAEGEKRPRLTDEDTTLAFNDIKYGKYIF